MMYLLFCPIFCLWLIASLGCHLAGFSVHMFPINWLLDWGAWLDGVYTFLQLYFIGRDEYFLMYHIHIMKHVMSDFSIINAPPYLERFIWGGFIWTRVLKEPWPRGQGEWVLPNWREKQTQKLKIITQGHDVKTSKFCFSFYLRFRIDNAFQF